MGLRQWLRQWLHRHRPVKDHVRGRFTCGVCGKPITWLYTSRGTVRWEVLEGIFGSRFIDLTPIR
jgi:hypothetical protein